MGSSNHQAKSPFTEARRHHNRGLPIEAAINGLLQGKGDQFRIGSGGEFHSGTGGQGRGRNRSVQLGRIDQVAVMG